MKNKNSLHHSLGLLPRRLTVSSGKCALGWIMASVLVVSVVCCQSAESPTRQPANQPASDSEDQAFHGITALLSKMHQGGENPSADDIKARREAGLEVVKNAKEFLKSYPESKRAEDVKGLISLGLSEAAVGGDSSAAEELDQTATATLKDPKIPDMLKLHTFLINYATQWARKNGKHALAQGSPEFQKTYMEGLFAALDVLTNREAIFKMLLLQAKSGHDFSPEQQRALAERVSKHPKATEAIKAEAQRILAGTPAFQIGKPLELSFTAVDGTKVDLQKMKGKVVLVDFWATWCGPCVAEVPNIKKVYDKLHPKGFEILGISLDEKKAELLAFTKKNEMTWPQYFDGKHWNNDISFRFGINSVPTEWLVDKKGVLRQTNARFELETAVEELLKED